MLMDWGLCLLPCMVSVDLHAVQSVGHVQPGPYVCVSVTALVFWCDGLVQTWYACLRPCKWLGFLNVSFSLSKQHLILRSR